MSFGPVDAALPEWAAGLPMARPVMGAGVLFVDDAGRVLLVKPSYKPGWDLPGGIVEPGESPRVAAGRELVEELGGTFGFGRLLVVDWAPGEPFGDKLLWIFEGEPLDAARRAAIRVDGVELLEAEWHEASRVPQLCPEGLAARILTALREREQGDGAHVYAEHGNPPA